MIALFSEKFSRKTRDQWAGIFEGSDGCVVPVLDFEEAAQHPHNVARETFFESSGVLQTSPVPRLSRCQPAKPKPSRSTGLEGKKILAEAGLSENEIADLENSNILL